MKEERRFITFSSAHGFPFVPDTDPPVFNQTLEEAEAEVIRWRIHADSVGGDAIVVEATKGE
jgi:hypothetical protein